MKLILFLISYIFFISCISVKEKKNDLIDSNILYPSYEGLTMAGYQGWFTAEGDGANRGWYHYQKDGRFEPGNSSIDFWPDVSEYDNIYETKFKHADGSIAYTYSSFDEKSIDLHFKWMKEYGIDGVFMQRFVVEIKNPTGKKHFNKVLHSALKSAKKFGRAISIMYDLSGCTSEDMAILLEDWDELQQVFSLVNNIENPTYLHHNNKPLLAIWGVGFNDNRKYTIEDTDQLITYLIEKNDVSIMLGVPYFWRLLERDAEKNPLLHTIIKKSDIIMPWTVGRYNSDSYKKISSIILDEDLQWCDYNNVYYVPSVFPGFSWGNLKNDSKLYNQISRNKGEFFWQQVTGAKFSGAKSLYLAMFDEVDEGTALFKSLRSSDVPLNGEGKFMGIEDELESDYYLWLAGEARNWFKGNEGYSSKKPERYQTN